MGKGSKSKRQMNVLIKRIKRKRALKKASHRTFSRPAEETNAQAASAQKSNGELANTPNTVQDTAATEQPETNEQAAE
jgi:hypothetical protein